MKPQPPVTIRCLKCKLIHPPDCSCEDAQAHHDNDEVCCRDCAAWHNRDTACPG